MRLFADDRESLETAYAGDVVGLANPGAFAIGDTLYGGKPVMFPPIPAFAPEHFRRAKYRVIGLQVIWKGVAQLREEGAVQVFYPWGTPRTEPILGAVGELQFEVANIASNRSTTSRAASIRCRTRSRCTSKEIAIASHARISLRMPSSSRIGTGGRSRSLKANGASGSRRNGIRSCSLSRSPRAPGRRRWRR